MERFFKSIDFIENNLNNRISIHDVAAASHYSTYHFSRVFKSLVGDTPKEYLRKRRLTLAAQRLLNENIGILSLALDCQFDSQEAFTRAFKATFKTTPAQYRNQKYRKQKHPTQNTASHLLYKEVFTPSMLNFLQNELSMEPQIMTRPPLKVVGIEAQYDNASLDLIQLWSAFRPFRDKIKHRASEQAFGIYESYQEKGEDVSFSYICSAAVHHFDDVPQGMITRELPEQLYAQFTHKGSIAHLNKTLKYIWGSWLPKSHYEYIEQPDFELYPSGYNPHAANSEMTIHIPIKSQ
ncbi:AraC family transcriptional regulator [uncultured Shewanella sp.]|uniref:AraC family transcriptional regulator n=1 Tax=uncultured Shewanella sp. TaxID=173975 RepID=UPI00260E3324|nr:AraC family transcriptional regulator [uncultured Shewanella sp.]